MRTAVFKDARGRRIAVNPMTAELEEMEDGVRLETPMKSVNRIGHTFDKALAELNAALRDERVPRPTEKHVIGSLEVEGDIAAKNKECPECGNDDPCPTCRARPNRGYEGL